MDVSTVRERGAITLPLSRREEYSAVIDDAFEFLRVKDLLSPFRKIIVKPNVVTSSPPPVTTDVECVRAVIAALEKRVESEILVAEGSGCGDTLENMRKNGYSSLGVPLVDLDSVPFSVRRNGKAEVLKEVYLPDVLEGAAIVSVAPAKEHTITGVTLSLKNLIGCLPSEKYSGFWSFKKSKVHSLDTHRVIRDLALYLRPVVSVIDAREGLMGGHLSGRIPHPPIGRVVVGTDPVAADREGCRLLGVNPDSIPHLRTC
ncbi:MAG: DUF362 domain-containing protein [Deltaproteobacteria bacterium]|nr:MAG: DUF362 domain-containing protein [Deltaproteobacteria bacterium]